MSGAQGDDAPADASHTDIIRAVAKMDGKMDANFTSLFITTRKQGDDLAAVRDRMTKLESRRNVRFVPRRTSRLKRYSGLAVGIVAVLGGISAAVHEGYSLVDAVIAAIVHPK